MRKLILGLALLLLSTLAKAQTPTNEARLGYCFNAVSGWLPIHAASMGSTISPQPVGINVYAMNGTTPTPLACDSSGNITGPATTNNTALATPSAPAVTAHCNTSCTFSWSYGVYIVNAYGATAVSPLTAGVNGSDNPDGVNNYWSITLPTVSGAVCGLYRNVNGNDPTGYGSGILALNTPGVIILHACDGSTVNDSDPSDGNVAYYSWTANWGTPITYSIPVVGLTTGMALSGQPLATNTVGIDSYVAPGSTNSDAYGDYAQVASGAMAFAIGPYTYANGNYSLAQGVGSIANGAAATAIGNFAYASGIDALAIKGQALAAHSGALGEVINNTSNSWALGISYVTFETLTAALDTDTGARKATQYLTSTVCSSTASPAACGASTAGKVQVAAAGTSLVIDSTAFTASTGCWFTYDTGGITAPTNMSSLLHPYISARTAGTSITITLPVAPSTNPVNVQFGCMN